MIGKSKNPRALKNTLVLPVHYASSKNAWMTHWLFRDWFFKHFVPKVTEYLKSANLTLRATLVLDICSAHGSSDELKTADGGFTTVFLPPNTTAVLQPLDQNVIQMVKANYRQTMLKEILGRPGEFSDNVKRINIKEAIFWVAEAWEKVPAESIAKSWKLLFTEPAFDDEDDEPLSIIRDRLATIRQVVTDKADPDDDDDENAEFEILSDADIVNAVLNPNTHFYEGGCVANATFDENANISTACDNEVDEHQPVSNESALNSIDTIITWAEENQLPLEKQFFLREIRGNILDQLTNKP